MHLLINRIISEINLDGIKWLDSQLVEQAKNSYKIQINCVIEEEKINVDDNILDTINSWEDYVETCEIIKFDQI